MTLEEQIKIAKRELDYRKRLYPTWVQSGKITQLEANYQIDGMECIISSLVALRKFELDILSKNEKYVKEVLTTP